MVAPIRKLREVRAEGVAILDELVRAKDAEASRAVATERAWLPKLLAALVPQGEAGLTMSLQCPLLGVKRTS